MSEEVKKEESVRVIEAIEAKVLKEIKDFWEGKTDTDYLTPKLTDTYRTVLAAWYSTYSEELSEIEKRYPKYWLEIRKEVGSTKEADMLYNQTADGQRRIEIRYRLKAIEKTISALRDRLSRMKQESFQ